jgi:succinate dehydrogenase hydrophobic anchor subunit
MKKTARAAALLVLAAPGLAFAASAPQTFQQLANQIASVLGSATTDLIVLAVVVYLWGSASSLFKGAHGRENLRKQLLWGILVIFVAVSIWGIVRLLQSSVFGGGADPTNGSGGSSVSDTCSNLNCNFGQ